MPRIKNHGKRAPNFQWPENASRENRFFNLILRGWELKFDPTAVIRAILAGKQNKIFIFLTLAPILFSRAQPFVQSLVQGIMSNNSVIIPAFFFRKKGYINFVSKSVCRPSVRLSVRLSVRAYVHPSRFL